MTPPHPRQALLRARIWVPFVLVGLIWGSTWWVITSQIDTDAGASWAIAWRFALATPAMFLLAKIMGRSLAIGAAGHRLALLLGLFQFCLNFNFVYRAELHLTSGIVAVMFGLLMVPNALFGRAFLGARITARFAMGSAIAIAGIALLLVDEARAARIEGDIAMGIFLAIGGILSASLANVIQAGKVGKILPMVSLLAWSMLYGTAIDFALAFAIAPMPALPGELSFWSGLVWLALIGSVVTFPLYYQIVREIGPGRAAYNGVFVLFVAMLISTVIEGYEWSLMAAGGAVLAVWGMVIALRARES